MNAFLSCDWGTSTLRLNLVDAQTGHIIAAESSDQGIAKTFTLWGAIGKTDKNSRIAFYLDILQQHIINMEQKLSVSLKGVKLFISGMASSSMGLIELPYSDLPFALSGPGLNLEHLPVQENFNHTITIVSGVKNANDVMRGEETQLMGCIDDAAGTMKNELFIFPGTHSKHILVNNNQIIDFKTYMTGDIFELLSQKSILVNSVEKENDLENPEFLVSFKQGVTDAVDSNLLNAVFKVRTNSLFNIYTQKQNFTYLSGLLIGSELKDLQTSTAERFHLLCGSALAMYYRTAFEQLRFEKKLHTYPPQWVDEAVVRAHDKIYNQMNYKQ